MENNIILDEENVLRNPQDQITGSYFAKASAVFHLLGIAGAFVAVYFATEINAALSTPAAPDATRLAEAIYWGLLSSWFILVMMVLGVVTRHFAFSRYQYRPVYLYKIQFWAAIITIMPAFFLNIFIFFHLFTKKGFYED